TQSAMHGNPCPDGAVGAVGAVGPDRAAAGTGPRHSTRQAARIARPRPTGGWYRRDPGPIRGRRGQSRPTRVSPRTHRRKLAGSDEKRLWNPGFSRINVRFMALATHRIDASVAPLGAGVRETQRRLLEAAVDGADVAATVEAVSRLTGSTAVLQDPFLAVLASAPPDGATALTLAAGAPVRELLRSGPGPVDGPPLVELARDGSGPARLVARVAARGELLGFLVVTAVDRVAYATLEAAAPVVALLLQAEDRLCRLLDRDRRELFLDLLAGRSPECLLLQGRRLGHNLDRPHWPLVFRAPGNAARLEAVVREALRQGGPPSWAEAVVGVDGDD